MRIRRVYCSVPKAGIGGRLSGANINNFWESGRYLPEYWLSKIAIRHKVLELQMRCNLGQILISCATACRASLAGSGEGGVFQPPWACGQTAILSLRKATNYGRLFRRELPSHTHLMPRGNGK